MVLYYCLDWDIIFILDFFFIILDNAFESAVIKYSMCNIRSVNISIKIQSICSFLLGLYPSNIRKIFPFLLIKFFVSSIAWSELETRNVSIMDFTVFGLILTRKWEYIRLEIVVYGSWNST